MISSLIIRCYLILFQCYLTLLDLTWSNILINNLIRIELLTRSIHPSYSPTHIFIDQTIENSSCAHAPSPEFSWHLLLYSHGQRQWCVPIDKSNEAWADSTLHPLIMYQYFINLNEEGWRSSLISSLV